MMTIHAPANPPTQEPRRTFTCPECGHKVSAVVKSSADRKVLFAYFQGFHFAGCEKEPEECWT